MKVYRFGLLAPTENAQLVHEQMRAAHRYRNDLVFIERARRAVMRDLLTANGARQAELDVAAAEARVQTAVNAVKADRIATRTRAASPATMAILKEAREAKKVALGRLREVRANLKAALSQERDAIEERVAEMRRGARSVCGVYWGTYLLIEDADQQMRKMPLYDGAEPNDPRFVRWVGEGRVGVQIQKGMTTEQVLSAQDTRLRIEPRPAPAGADPTSKRSAKRKYVDLVMRVGSDPTGEPVWARWPMVMHRPMPVGGRVKRAAVVLKKIGPRDEWYVTITVDGGDERQRPMSGDPVSGGPSVVGVDLGWRLTETGIRVGAWRGSDGRSGFIEVPERFISRMRKVDDLEAIRDKAFNAARDALATWIAARGGDLPPWFIDATKTIYQWRSQERLTKLVRRWRDSRFDGDELAYGETEGWRYHDHHLWEWSASQRKKTLRFRREFYSILAARLSREYDVLSIEKNLDLSRFAKIPTVASPSGLAGEPAQRVQRHLVAASELRERLMLAFGGRRVVHAPAEFTTMSCHVCGSLEEWDQAAEVEHTCGACGAHWDQDDNAARNLLALAREQRGDGGSSETAREDGKDNDSTQVAESRWVRARRMKDEKRARKEVARTEGGNT